MVPATEVMVVLPQMLDPTTKSGSRVNRAHSHAVKESIRLQLKFHHTRRIPDHFNFYRQKKYKYKKRSSKTHAIKRRFGQDRADLVRTSQSKIRATQTRIIRVGGSTAGGKIVGRLIMKIKPGMKDGATPIKVRDIKEEIKTVAPAEEVRMVQHFRFDYARLIREGLKPRTLVRMSTRLKSLGI